MEQKLEAMRLEASIAEMIQKEEKKKREALEAKEKEHREKNKMLLEAHRIKKEAEHQKALEDKQKRLLDLEMALSEQAQHDRERFVHVCLSMMHMYACLFACVLTLFCVYWFVCVCVRPHMHTYKNIPTFLYICLL